jgi:hypothetical protein
MMLPRNLGPMLAITGAVVASAACIAGFIVIGGPGDARANRLDMATMQRVAAVADAAQCGFRRKGAAPKTMDDIKQEAEKDTDASQLPPGCQYVDRRLAQESDAVEYSAPDLNHVRICAKFERPTRQRANEYSYGWDSPIGELHQERKQAGRYCFNIELVNPQPVIISPGISDSPSQPGPDTPK